MRGQVTGALAGVVAMCALTLGAANVAFAQSPGLPEIRTSAKNRVPPCVTPERLMHFLRSRHETLPVRYVDIGRYYRDHGERLGVRWDYAFFQMLLETNYLKFRTSTGKGDVDPRQNNFAGLGTTGGGVPGEAFPDVSTGVLAQIQHLVAYSGERVEQPVGRRTRDMQDGIIHKSRALKRPVTFRDLTWRWAMDRRYGASIESIADRFRDAYCSGKPLDPEIIAAETRRPVLVTQPQPAVKPLGCRVFTASYGGRKNMLIRARVGGEMHYTALQVLDGMEQTLAENFITSHARGGDAVGEFPTREAALIKAFDLCPTARAP